MSITSISSSGIDVNSLFTPDPQAKGRNGDDRVWEAAHQAIRAGKLGIALEMVQTLNAFYRGNATDELLNASDLTRLGIASGAPTRLVSRLADAVRVWNAACRERLGLPIELSFDEEPTLRGTGGDGVVMTALTNEAMLLEKTLESLNWSPEKAGAVLSLRAVQAALEANDVTQARALLGQASELAGAALRIARHGR